MSASLVSLACAVCMGADSQTGPALNGAIFLMLGCIGSMLSLVAGFGWSIFRRAQRHAAENPDLQNLIR